MTVEIGHMSKPKSSILGGYRVLDLTDEKGAFCTRLLADMGADVIRMEGVRQKEKSSFDGNNLGKRSITLNLETEAGQELFKKLVKTADILVESYQPGYFTNLGLDYEALNTINPRLIMVSITDFGQTGPYRDYKSSDLVTAALGGQVHVNGEPGMPPLKPYGSQAYHTASLFAANGTLLALWQRHTSGKGQHIDIAAMECVAATLDHVLVRYFYEGVAAKRQGSLYWNNAFHVFPCQDGYILLSISWQWPTLVEWLKSENMAEDLTDSKWLEHQYRDKNIDHLIKVMEQWTKTHTVAELVEQGQAIRLPLAPINSIPEVLENPQLKERGFLVEAEDAQSHKKFKYPGAPVKMSRSPLRVDSRIPTPGEDNSSIYHNELGLSGKEIDEMKKKGII